LTTPGGDAAKIRISLKYYNIVADLLERKKEQRRVPDGTTISDMLKNLAQENSSFAKLALTTDGEVSQHLRLFRAGQAVLDLHEPLNEGDEILIFPAIAGG
jgi:molybdopterin converting factor small subunit